MQRKVNVVEDLDGNKIVFIHDIRFKGKVMPRRYRRKCLKECSMEKWCV